MKIEQLMFEFKPMFLYVSEDGTNFKSYGLLMLRNSAFGVVVGSLDSTTKYCIVRFS